MNLNIRQGFIILELFIFDKITFLLNIRHEVTKYAFDLKTEMILNTECLLMFIVVF